MRFMRYASRVENCALSTRYASRALHRASHPDSHHVSHQCGESFYNPMLQDVVGDLEQLGLGEVSDGALVVWLEGYKSRDGGAQPLLVRKSDGGFLYATTDLAAIRQRVGARDGGAGEGADRVLYVTDSGQSSHFDQVF